MILSRKVRLRPTPEQESKLWQSVGTARYIYNYTLVNLAKKPPYFNREMNSLLF